MRENGGSRITLCGENTHRSRTSRATVQPPSAMSKNRVRRASDTCSSSATG